MYYLRLPQYDAIRLKEREFVENYNFNQGIPSGDNTGLITLPDLSPTGNNGTLANFALTGASSNFVAQPVPPSATTNAGVRGIINGNSNMIPLINWQKWCF